MFAEFDKGNIIFAADQELTNYFWPGKIRGN